MFPMKTIRDALGIEPAMSGRMAGAVAQWMGLFEHGGALALPATIAGELARLVTVESALTVTGRGRGEFLNAQLAPVRAALRRQVEVGIAGGALAFKPCPRAGGLAVEFVRADAFYPVAFDSTGRICGAVFLETAVRGATVYHRLEYHHLENGGCVIENRAFAAPAALGDGVLGQPVPLARVDAWAALEPVTAIRNVDRLLLGYFRVPLANTLEPDSPIGVSCYSRAVGLIRQAEEQWERILWEYRGTELAVHADEMLFKTDGAGGRVLPAGHERLYRLVPGLENRMDVFSPAIRDTPLFNGFNNILKRIEFQCCLAYGTLSDPQNVDKTAEEIRASKQRSFSVVRDMQKALESALDDLIYAMDVWATLGGLAPAGAYQTAYSWDDSIINDPAQRKQMFWGYVTAGRFPMWRYLAEFEGYSEEDAKAVAAEAANGAERGAEQP